MRKGLLTTILTFIVSSAGATEFLEFGAKNFKSTKLHKSKWVFDFGANYMAYPTTMPAFQGAHKSIKAKDTNNIYGMNLGFGGEIHLGGGFSTTVKVGGFYSKTLDKTVGQAAKDIDLELANESSDHMVYGGEGSASLNYLFETKSYGIQPFIEFGIGTGVASIEQQYDYKGVTGGTNPNPESYDIKMDEGFNYARSTLGLNIISATGILFYTKVSSLGMVVNKRKIKGSIKTAAKSSTDSVNTKKTNLNEANEVFMASVGMGFLF